MIFYGRNVTQEAIRSKFSASSIYIQQDINIDKKLNEIVQEAQDKNIPVSSISLKKLQQITESNEHQGIAIDLQFRYRSIKELNSAKSLIYISEFTYEHNLGAIVRTAEVSGLGGVIIPKNKNISPISAKTSAGAIFHIPILKESIFNTIKSVKSIHYQIIGIERDGTAYYDLDLTQQSLFIIGGEDKELSEPVREKCDAIAEIPQFGNVNSLNMSVATSIVLYEQVRQNSNF